MEAVAQNGSKPFILKIGGVDLDLSIYPPITQGDKKKIRKEPYNLDMRKLGEFEEEQESLFVLFLLKRVRPETTIEEVDALPAKVIQSLAGYCMRKSAEVDDPFSTRSTSLAPNTGGPSAK